MKIFLDTSSLVKLYHREVGTTELELIFSTVKITDIFLSEVSRIELTSTIWKKVRTKEIMQSEAQTTLDLFESDLENTVLLQLTVLLLNKREYYAQNMEYKGLRTLDSIQLSTSVSLFQKVDLFYTADKLLKSLFEVEGLPTQMPSR